jgi:hypothetical protein
MRRLKRLLPSLLLPLLLRLFRLPSRQMQRGRSRPPRRWVPAPRQLSLLLLHRLRLLRLLLHRLRLLRLLLHRLRLLRHRLRLLRHRLRLLLHLLLHRPRSLWPLRRLLLWLLRRPRLPTSAKCSMLLA